MRDLNFSHCFRNYIVANFELVEYIETYEIAVSGVIADMYRITVFTVFRLLTDFVCLYNYEFGLSLCKIVRSSVILLLPLFTDLRKYDKKKHMSQMK